MCVPFYIIYLPWILALGIENHFFMHTPIRWTSNDSLELGGVSKTLVQNVEVVWWALGLDLTSCGRRHHPETDCGNFSNFVSLGVVSSCAPQPSFVHASLV